MRKLTKMNKKAGFTDLFLLMIFTVVIALIIGVFIFIGTKTTEQLHLSMDGMDIGDGNNNVSVVIENTMGAVRQSYYTLRWLGVLIFFGMILGIMIGSYMVQTKPIFFVPYIFIVIIAVVVSAGISNAYEMVIENETITSTFATMGAINWFTLKLPMIISIVGFIGGLIMFSRLGKREEVYYGY